MTTQIAVRLPDDLLARVDALGGPNRSEAVRRALEEFVDRLECERDAESCRQHSLTAEERAMAGGGSGWEATPPW